MIESEFHAEFWQKTYTQLKNVDTPFWIVTIILQQVCFF